MPLKSVLLSIVLWLPFATLAQDQDIFSAVNSPYDEQCPVISPDGNTLYFTRANHPENVGGEIDPGDIWYSNLMPDGKWSTPANARILNNTGWNGVLGFVGGSDAIYLHHHYNRDGSKPKTQGISRSLKTTSGWSFPENFEIPYFVNKSKIHGGYITEDAGIALFSLESYDSRGGEDIYVCFNKGAGNWSEPKNLGNTINTTFQEFTPFLSKDTKTLYFASNGRDNGTDIYYSERLDESWINWSEPLPMILINSYGKELAPRIYGPNYLYTSTKDSDGYGDIRLFVNPEIEPEEQDSVKEEQVVQLVPKIPVFDERFITLFGNAYNQKTNEPLEVKVSLKSEANEVLNTVQAYMGSYALKIESVGTYQVRVDAPGYVSYQETLILESDEIKSLQKDFRLQPIEVGTTVNLKDVLFKQSRAEFLESSYAALNLVVEFMKDNPKVEIRLEGHTDNRGVAKYNMRLSKDRVDAVRDYLIKKGISKRRISGKGYGGSQPIADNDNPETRVLNRRVEFTIVKN